MRDQERREHTGCGVKTESLKASLFTIGQGHERSAVACPGDSYEVFKGRPVPQNLLFRSAGEIEGK